MKNYFQSGILHPQNQCYHIFRIMRLTTYLLLFFACFGYAENTLSQNARVKLNKQHSILREVLDEIEQQTEYLFVSNREVNLDQKVSVRVRNKPVREALDEVLRDAGINYAVEGVNIVLSKRPETTQQAQKRITGTVVDDRGDPVTGANVMEKGAINGAITDIDGNFSLLVPENATLQISFIGYIAQEIRVTNQDVYSIILKEDTQLLDEVVVVGYGTMRKKDLTGSVVQIRPDKIANEAPKSVQDVLRGTPGLAVGYDASAKGGGSMEVRGRRSVYDEGGHNNPLLILDGMPFYGELSEINPNDIGQIDILKDASSAAVYGSKAANGVILITTKKGKLGKPTVNISSNIGVSQVYKLRRRFSPEDYLTHRQDWYEKNTYGVNPDTGEYEAYQRGNYANQPGYYRRPDQLSGVSLDDWRAYTSNNEGESDLSIWARRMGFQGNALENLLAGKITDWYDKTYRTGFNQDYNASVSGASEKANYYFSLGYMKNEGADRSDDYQAIRANMKIDTQVNKWLQIGANVNFQDRSDGKMGIDIDYQMRNSPYADYTDADGNLAQYPLSGEYSQRGYNYDFQRQYMELDKGYTVFNSILFAKVTLPFNITYTFNASPRFQYFHDRYFTSAQLPDSNPKDRGVNREQTKRFDWSLNNTINWDYTLLNKHHFIVTLVQEAEQLRSWKDRIEARNIQPSDALGFHNTQNGAKEDSKYESEDTNQTADALMARLFYSYDSRYMLTTSVRRDGYSAFGSSNPYATFPSVALAWSFADESFFKWNHIMSTGKLRASWGKNGNRSLANPYVALANLTGSNMHGYLNSSGELELMRYLYADRMANPNLQWEKTEAWNFGLDFGFLNNRISGSVEYYIMKTHDMIMEQRLPEFSGFPKITTNLGQVNNTGFEISLNTLNIDNKNFQWNTTFNLSYNKNRIKHLAYDYEDVLDAQGNVIGRKESDDITNGWFIGKSIGEIWDYRVTGIWQKDEVEEAARHGQVPGDPKVANNYTADDIINDDGTITPVYNNNDKEFLGSTIAPINWSMRNEFVLWKDFSISFNIYSKMGHKRKAGYYRNFDDDGGRMTYALQNVTQKEYWTPDNPTNDYARIEALGPTGADSPDKVYSGTFIRLENISLAYTLPRNLTTKWQIDRVKVFGTIRNVAVWAKDWDYGDPELDPAPDKGNGLSTRNFTFGVNLTF
ncbi:MAG: SusC/RagA family TonB-linked outer membrane protein [Tannerellaceae bacterium]|nr:SusC/RagA family TonB-linked outer membrane protein [Tannerellaceae bacterium]